MAEDSCSTPVKSAKSKTTTSLSYHVDAVLRICALNGMHYHNDDAAQVAHNIIDKAERIIGQTRHSPNSKAKLDRLDEVRHQYANRNEATFVNKFIPLFRAVDRHVTRPNGALEDANSQDLFLAPAESEIREWEQDGLDENFDRVFRSKSIPKLETDDKAMRAAVDKLPKVANPKPDVVFGKYPAGSCA